MLELGAAPIEGERFGLGRRHLGAHARDVELGDVARAPAPFGERQRYAVSGERFLDDESFHVERPHREVGLRDRGLDEEARALQQRFARLCIENGGGARVRKPAEEVHFVGRSTPVANRLRSGPTSPPMMPRARLALAPSEACNARSASVIRATARACKARRRHLHSRVGAVGALDELIQHRVVECLPPFAARLRLGRRGDGEALMNSAGTGGSFCGSTSGSEVAQPWRDP